MTDTLIDEPEAGTPFEYRELHPGADFRLVSAELTVDLLNDALQARYLFTCELETLGDTPATLWYHDIPAQAKEVRNLHASDATGTLQSEVLSGNRGTALLEIRLRDAVPQGKRYTFSFRYETGIRSVISARALSKIVAYSDWHIFNVPCDLIEINIQLPPRSTLVRAVPVAELDAENRIRYSIKGLRSGEAIQYLVGYNKRQIGVPFYLWLASAIASGFIGALIAEGLEQVVR